MPEPTIVAPPPTVVQPSREPIAPIPSGDVDTSPGLEQLQSVFDRVLPEKGPKKAVSEAPPTAPAPPAPPVPDKPPVRETEPPPPPTPPPSDKEPKLPSFLEEALRTEKPSTQKPPVADEVETEWSDELPPEQKQSRIKGLRDAYKRVKTELDTIKQRPPGDQVNLERMAALEQQNRQFAEMLSRTGVEYSPDFQQNIMRPLYASWNEAARIVKESGGDPENLRAAMSQTGRAQFEALDALFADLPESAKAEAHDALRNYRRYESARQAAIADAPRTLEAIRARETQRQSQELGKARNEMKNMFDTALSTLRDEAKVEVFLKTGSPETEWWDKQGDQIIQQARDLFLENTDLNKMAYACLLAPAADAYRNLFMKAQKRVAELNQIIKEKGWNEPVLSESGGNAAHLTNEAQTAEDLKKPFAQVFLREFHKSQARTR